MDLSAYLPVVETESTRLADQALSDPTAVVPHCEGWDNAALVTHVGNVYRRIAALVDARPESVAEIPRVAADEPDVDDLALWFGAARDRILQVLTDAGADTPVWTWGQDATSAFYHRRMAHETTLHRLDADLATSGALGEVAPAFASDGLDEYCHVGLRYSMSRPERTYPEGSLHLHCTDTTGEWTIRPDGTGGIVVAREHAKGDVAVRGPALNLLRYVWGREREGVDVFGDEGLADAWARCAP